MLLHHNLQGCCVLTAHSGQGAQGLLNILDISMPTLS